MYLLYCLLYYRKVEELRYEYGAAAAPLCARQVAGTGYLYLLYYLRQLLSVLGRSVEDLLYGPTTYSSVFVRTCSLCARQVRIRTAAPLLSCSKGGSKVGTMQCSVLGRSVEDLLYGPTDLQLRIRR